MVIIVMFLVNIIIIWKRIVFSEEGILIGLVLGKLR